MNNMVIKQNNYEKVLKIFFDNPNSRFHIREIARISGLNPNTIINISKKLLREELIKREKKKHIVELFANVNEKFKEKKRINNFKKVIDSRLVDFLKERFNAEAISMIGSYSRGEDSEESDVDIVVISKQEYETLDLSKFEKILGKEIHLIISDYKKMSNEFYINLINGIILYGYITKK